MQESGCTPSGDSGVLVFWTSPPAHRLSSHRFLWHHPTITTQEAMRIDRYNHCKQADPMLHGGSSSSLCQRKRSFERTSAHGPGRPRSGLLPLGTRSHEGVVCSSAAVPARHREAGREERPIGAECETTNPNQSSPVVWRTACMSTIGATAWRFCALQILFMDTSIQGVLQLRQRLLERATSYYAWARVFA